MRNSAGMPYIRIIIRHACHSHHVPGIHFHSYCEASLRIGMRLTINSMGMQPAQLVKDRSLSSNLDILMDIQEKIVSLLRRRDSRDTRSHIPRIYGNTSKAVLAP
ncbi:hypothetical protein D3C81_1468110 [compost metagenome]